MKPCRGGFILNALQSGNFRILFVVLERIGSECASIQNECGFGKRKPHRIGFTFIRRNAHDRIGHGD